MFFDGLELPPSSTRRSARRLWLSRVSSHASYGDGRTEKMPAPNSARAAFPATRISHWKIPVMEAESFAGFSLRLSESFKEDGDYCSQIGVNRVAARAVGGGTKHPGVDSVAKHIDGTV
jgi:hypothetical protein